MRKIYLSVNIINIICGLLLFINCYFVFDYNNLSILFLIGLLLFYITAIIVMIKRKKDFTNLDIFVTSIYFIFFIIIFIFSIIMQNNNQETFNMMYYTKIIFIPHIIYVFYNLI